MSKKVIVMTGATSGFGVNWLQSISQNMNASFYILARSEVKFTQLLSTIPTLSHKNVHFVYCELSSLQSISDAISYVKTQVATVDVLINNAGIFSTASPHFNDANIELTFMINHLAPLLITLLLEDRLSMNSNAKVINTSSFQHFNAKLTFEDINFTKSTFDPMLAYQNSKLCITLSTVHLAKHLRQNITICCFDPGIVDTSMTKVALPMWIKWAYPLVRHFFRDCVKGAETGIYLTTTTNEKIKSGGYYKNKTLKQTSSLAKSRIFADQLHQLSMQIIEPYLQQ